ncbi:MAG: response regulator [Xanthomonadaceae bacterium]|nr:response regulator [Xanthomonadaceae bacterium]MDP2185699.1 response regulator [Xanthomonadales bacterium]MDZ4116861.1 response regulator [Xanthomonadaceae bacterium]MDZ4379333.1 response regulator [Xanthomonadaceae bacterium]
MNARTILLVEDNPSDIALTRRAFDKSRIGNPLIVCEDGQEALDYLFAQGTHADRCKKQMPALILLDINLPRLDGLSVLRQIRENPLTRRLPVVILTSSTEQSDLAAGYDAGANSYIRKPVSFERFVDAITQLGMYWLVINEAPPKAEIP